MSSSPGSPEVVPHHVAIPSPVHCPDIIGSGDIQNSVDLQDCAFKCDTGKLTCTFATDNRLQGSDIAGAATQSRNPGKREIFNV